MINVDQMTNLENQIIEQSKTKQEPDWLLQYRLENFDKFKISDLPHFDTVNLEKLNLTNLTDIKLKVNEYQLNSFDTHDFYSKAELQELGVIFADIDDVIQNNPDLIHEYFMSDNFVQKNNQITYLHNATFNHGQVIIIPDHLQLKKAILYDLLLDVKDNTNLINHLLVVAGKNTQAELIQNIGVRSENENIAYVFMEIIAKEDAKVTIQTLDQNDTHVKTYFYRRSYAMKNAQVDWNIASMNAHDSIVDLEANLLGEGSSTNSNVISTTFNDIYAGINNRVNNLGMHTVGNILQRGVILDDSNLIFNGVGKIYHGARGSNAQQENRVLILSKTAQGNANPILLIDENDVQAGHAASVGKIDEEKMRYLLSRGLTEKIAKKLLIKAFLRSVLEKSSVKNYDQIVLDLIEDKLNEA